MLTSAQAANTAAQAALIARRGGGAAVTGEAVQAPLGLRARIRRFAVLFAKMFALVLCFLATVALLAVIGAWLSTWMGLDPEPGAVAAGVPAAVAFAWSAMTVIIE